MKQIFFGLALFFLMITIPCAAVSKENTAPKAAKKAIQARVPKGYEYVLKERMNFETTMFHLKSMLERQENEKAALLLRHRVDYLKGSLLKVLADEGFTKEEKKKIKALNKLEINWLEKKIEEVGG